MIFNDFLIRYVWFYWWIVYEDGKTRNTCVWIHLFEPKWERVIAERLLFTVSLTYKERRQESRMHVTKYPNTLTLPMHDNMLLLLHLCVWVLGLRVVIVWGYWWGRVLGCGTRLVFWGKLSWWTMHECVLKFQPH